MLFRNDTKDKIKYRVGTHKEGYSFFTIRPGETGDFTKERAESIGLTRVVEKKEPTKESTSDKKKRLLDENLILKKEGMLHEEYQGLKGKQKKEKKRLFKKK